MAKPAVGTVVHANFGSGEEEAVVIAHGADKDLLLPVSALEKVGYREPDDRDAEGSGRTYWTKG